MATLQLFALDILYFFILESWLYMQLLKLLAFCLWISQRESCQCPDSAPADIDHCVSISRYTFHLPLLLQWLFFRAGPLFSAHLLTLQFYEQRTFQTIFWHSLYTLPNANFSLSSFSCFLDSLEIKKIKYASMVFYEKEVSVAVSLVLLQLTTWASRSTRNGFF